MPSPAFLLFSFVLVLCFAADAYARPLDSAETNPLGHLITTQHTVQQTIPCCATISGTLRLQGHTDHSGIRVQMWPGTNLQTTTDSDGRFSFNGLSAGVDDESSTYAIEVTYPNHLGPRTSINLRDYLVDENTHVIINFPDLWLLGGDVNGDNRINIFDLVIVGSHYGTTGASPGDINGDGRVNIQDLAIAAGNFGKDNSYIWEPP
ncbi:MAG: hypothetical protein KDD84_21140 [Caldilineaceae bacterium]|nr:hypothetical protein [Caldilineaceae bacterium]